MQTERKVTFMGEGRGIERERVRKNRIDGELDAECIQISSKSETGTTEEC